MKQVLHRTQEHLHLERTFVVFQEAIWQQMLKIDLGKKRLRVRILKFVQRKLVKTCSKLKFSKT